MTFRFKPMHAAAGGALLACLAASAPLRAADPVPRPSPTPQAASGGPVARAVPAMASKAASAVRARPAPVPSGQPQAVSSPPAAPVGSPIAEGTAAAAAPAAAASAPVSSAAQRLYERARHQLVQVRTLLSGQGSQASVGSGFFVGQEGLIVTNYHVISQMALQPERYRLTYVGVDGRQGPLELLAFDAVNDLAVVRPAQAAGLGGAPAGVAAVIAPSVAPGSAPDSAATSVPGTAPAPATGTATPPVAGMAFRPRAQPLNKGEHIYSLGNPLDVGFAVVEGTYNGLVERGFKPSIFFSGSLNPGMSGGPALDGDGRVMGVNVATRLDGQQVSFLVPAGFAEELVARARQAKPISSAVWPELTRQLLAHQDELTRRFMAQRWRTAGHERYQVPVPQEVFMRCWGSSSSPDNKGLQYERSECSMNQSVYISGGLHTGSLKTQHEIYDGRKLGPLRFARQYSRSFRNEHFGGGARRTAAQCSERFIENGGLPLRAVLCMSAYRKLTGLYDMGVLVAAVSDDTTGMQGRFDATGVSYENALKLAEFYLKGYGWIQTPKAMPKATPAKAAPAKAPAPLR